MEEPLLHRLTAGTARNSPSTTAILTRLSVVLFLAAVSVWANHEASRGFEIAVLNSAADRSPAARRFDLMFVSNGRAARFLNTAAESVDRSLHPDDRYPRRPVRRITLQLAGDSVATAAVDGGVHAIRLDPGVISRPGAVEGAVFRAVALALLWDGEGAAPAEVLEAVVEYLVESAGLGRAPAEPPLECWGRGGGGFLRFCEERSRGFVARLNRGMRLGWSEGEVDLALGSSARRMCADYRSAVRPGSVTAGLEPEQGHVS